MESETYTQNKEEKINGVIYNMSPAPGFKHGIINGNLHALIKQGLKGSLCLVFMENLDFRYHPDINDDYVCPDIMIVCDRKHLKGSFYSGVEEFWTVSPQGKSINIYYLENGKYHLEQSYILQEDEEEDDYNAKTWISLRAFPNIKMRLEDVFENVD